MNLQWLALRIMNEPLFVMLIDPRTLGYFKGASPDTEGQTEAINIEAEIVYPPGKLGGVWRRVLTAGILVPFVNQDGVIPQLLQMLGKPLRIGTSLAVRDPRHKLAQLHHPIRLRLETRAW